MHSLHDYPTWQKVHINVLLSIHFSKAVPLFPGEIYLAAVSIGLMWSRCFKADFSLSALLQALFNHDGLGFGDISVCGCEWCWVVWG